MQQVRDRSAGKSHPNVRFTFRPCRSRPPLHSLRRAARSADQRRPNTSTPCRFRVRAFASFFSKVHRFCTPAPLRQAFKLRTLFGSEDPRTSDPRQTRCRRPLFHPIRRYRAELEQARSRAMRASMTRPIALMHRIPCSTNPLLELLPSQRAKHRYFHTMLAATLRSGHNRACLCAEFIVPQRHDKQTAKPRCTRCCAHAHGMRIRRCILR